MLDLVDIFSLLSYRINVRNILCYLTNLFSYFVKLLTIA